MMTSGVVAISSGYSHTCALTSAGGVKCWGNGGAGQLGNNIYADSNVPVNVLGLSSGVASVGTGFWHTCAVTTSGGAKCWGSNNEGMLGNGTTTTSPAPVDVVGLASGVSAIAGGDRFSCALMTAGGVKCWGENGWGFGQLGNNRAQGEADSPVDVTGLTSGVAAIAVGSRHACAVTTSGGVKCWGNNYYGQLGDGTTTDRYVPVDVSGLTSGVSAIAAGQEYTCALTTVGGVKCWGRDNGGVLGDGNGGDSLVPVAVTRLGGGVAAISAGSYSMCALMVSGGIKCWGGGGNGNLGDNTTLDRGTPVDVVSFTAPKTRNDFNGDYQSDALFLNSGSGGSQYWKSATKSQAVYPGTYDTSYSYAGTGDFNGDGKADILFVKASNNGALYWSGAVKTAAT